MAETSINQKIFLEQNGKALLLLEAQVLMVEYNKDQNNINNLNRKIIRLKKHVEELDN
ncbi:14779_t:CDS:1, partial [Racocetra fulgida]